MTLYDDPKPIREDDEIRKDGRMQSRKTVADDKLTSSAFAPLNNSVGQSQLKYETGTITISGTNVSGTAAVTSGSIPFGAYISVFTGSPAASYIQAVVSGTTLTVTLTAAPGAGNSVTIVVRLIKT